VQGALERVRSSEIPPTTLTTVYLRDGEGRLSGSALVVTLLRSDPLAPLSQIADTEPVSVHTDADLPDVARTMTDYNLVMLPVVDDDRRIVGVVTVDDVLELTLPAGWRRRFGLARD
jgi:Mg/Co/Ni transporter MgtE